MSGNFKTNRTDFEQTFLKLNPDSSVKRDSNGNYVSHETAYGWAAYRKAFAQCLPILRKANSSITRVSDMGTFVVGKYVPPVRGDNGHASSFVFRETPNKHRTLMKAERERQYLIEKHPDQKFEVFSAIRVPAHVSKEAISRNREFEQTKIDTAWGMTIIELEQIQATIAIAQDAKDEDVLKALRRRCINIHHERIALNIQRSKFTKEPNS